MIKLSFRQPFNSIHQVYMYHFVAHSLNSVNLTCPIYHYFYRNNMNDGGNVVISMGTTTTSL